MPENATDHKKSQPQHSQHLELYRQTLKWLFGSTIIVSGIIGIPLFIADVTGFVSPIPPTLGLVAFAGALGALFSALTRLYSLRELPAALLLADSRRAEGSYLLIFCLVPPLIGMIGAVFFYVFMASGIVTSNLFVNFVCESTDPCEGIAGFLSYSAELPSDYAKAMVWGFVAGFSERLVPNVLARLENSGNESVYSGP